MSPRALRLHLRARGGAGFTVGLAAVAVLACATAQWLSTRPSFDGPGARVPVVVFAPLLAALLLGPTLAGADEDLERGTPVPWRRWRAAHVLLAAAAIGGVLALAGLPAPDVFGAHALIRNALGCTGLVVGAAVLLGARLAWLPAFCYVCGAQAAAPRQPGGAAGVWAWPVQPSTVGVSWWAAGALFVIGAVGYLTVGARRTGGHAERFPLPSRGSARWDRHRCAPSPGTRASGRAG